jgi:hypothetical protein
MKAVATLLALLLASCALAADPQTATTEDNAIITRVLPQVNTSCLWVAGRNCYGQPNDGNNIWPSGMGITSVQVLVRSGPDRLEHKQQTFLAFVVWNSAFVGRIFQVDSGSPDAVDWQRTLNGIVAGRTISLFDTQAGSTGSTVGGPGPIPHPNVVGPITFENNFLDVVRKQAGIIDDATTAFLGTSVKGVDF